MVAGRSTRSLGFMKSGRQRRDEIELKRAKKREKAEAYARAQARRNQVVVNTALLRPTNSYSIPDFVERGWYIDRPFRCKDCGKSEVWIRPNRSGGTNQRKGMFGQSLCGAGRVVVASESELPQPGRLKLKGPQGNVMKPNNTLERTVEHLATCRRSRGWLTSRAVWPAAQLGR